MKAQKIANGGIRNGRDFSLSEQVIPGTYIDVRAEGLIGVGGLSTGNIGIVGTARNLDENCDPVEDEDGNPVYITGKTFILSDYATAQETLGRYDAFGQKPSTSPAPWSSCTGTARAPFSPGPSTRITRQPATSAPLSTS